MFFPNRDPGNTKIPLRKERIHMNYAFSERVKSLKPSAIREILKNSSAPGIIPLSAGNPAPEAFPYKDIEAISPKICNSATLSTLHGCPPQEIEGIARYLLTEKGMHTFVEAGGGRTL